MFAKFYYFLDEWDPGHSCPAPPRRRLCGSLQRSGATREGILEAAKDDYWRVLEANAESLNLREEGARQRSA